MNDAERRARISEIRIWCSPGLLEPPNHWKEYAQFLLTELDSRDAALREAREERNRLRRAPSARAAGARAGIERALQWVDAIHQGKDNSRDPAVVDNTCIRIRHAIRALLHPATP